MRARRRAAPAAARACAPVGPGRDREFLPAALEILETPPPPLPVALMLTICAVFAAALAWSFFGRLDVNAVAPGQARADRAGQGDPAARSRQDRRHPGRQRPAGQGRRPAARARPRGSRRRRARGARGAAGAASSEIARRRLAIDAARAAQRASAENGAPLPALEALAANPQGKIALGRAAAGGVQAARGGGAARRPHPARRRAARARQADGAEAGDAASGST